MVLREPPLNLTKIVARKEGLIVASTFVVGAEVDEDEGVGVEVRLEARNLDPHLAAHSAKEGGAYDGEADLEVVGQPAGVGWP